MPSKLGGGAAFLYIVYSIRVRRGFLKLSAVIIFFLRAGVSEIAA